MLFKNRVICHCLFRYMLLFHSVTGEQALVMVNKQVLLTAFVRPVSLTTICVTFGCLPSRLYLHKETNIIKHLCLFIPPMHIPPTVELLMSKKKKKSCHKYRKLCILTNVRDTQTHTTLSPCVNDPTHQI